MVKLMTKFSVKDFNEWLKVFNDTERNEVRMKAGLKNPQIYRASDNGNVVILITEWENIDKAKAFSQSAELREGQQRAGVISKPEVYVLQPLPIREVEKM